MPCSQSLVSCRPDVIIRSIVATFSVTGGSDWAPAGAEGTLSTPLMAVLGPVSLQHDSSRAGSYAEQGRCVYFPRTHTQTHTSPS